MNDEEKIIVMVFVLTMASNPFVGLAPFYVAMDKGFFKDCGLDFSMVDFDDSSASCSALLAGKVDLAYTTLDAAIIAESQYEEDMLDVTQSWTSLPERMESLSKMILTVLQI